MMTQAARICETISEIKNLLILSNINFARFYKKINILFNSTNASEMCATCKALFRYLQEK